MESSRFKRIHLIVMDSVGIGEAPDAGSFDDEGADTLGNIAEKTGGLNLPNLGKLGLSNIREIKGVPPAEKPEAFWTKMREASLGKDTLTGHWELMGLVTSHPFKVFPNGFPELLITRIEKETGRTVIGNTPASGTEIIDRLGEEHMKTGSLIVYTSADSVLQIAAHEDIVPLEELYEICKKVRELTQAKEFKVGRVIARPFVGEPGNFTRTKNRKDYALKPFDKTVMNELEGKGCDVIAIGKIHDIYDGEGITESIKTESNSDGADQLEKVMDKDFTGLSFLNLVDFDAVFGHRRDVEGYAKALEEFDQRIPSILDKLKEDDLLIITADHGNDPTHHGTDHTREFVPLLVYSKQFKEGKELPVRKSFADVGATIASNFCIKWAKTGESFLDALQDE